MTVLQVQGPTGATARVVVDGPRLRFVWDDALVDVLELGVADVRRASHVEPCAGGRGWTADLRPSEGPVLGPFRTRQEALAAERTWLEQEMGL